MREDELEHVEGAPLPDREAMSLVPLVGGEDIGPLLIEPKAGEEPPVHTLPVEPAD